ncbi:MAG: four helix bundle protein [Sporocytophaga sp.]|jgi:four helix bundle protein|uniref:four helix bundle protein n=1 Tax=Sporocytophaga TaxID=1011 RepID=UPI000424B8D1|nr:MULTISPECIES: four helix bundle protein [Sporocytophaga]MBO9700244.1 four helix bundle protein [Sporocytophaga sp.]MCR6639348.1 four helix bundle protein [Sporocytophaga sp.]
MRTIGAKKQDQLVEKTFKLSLSIIELYIELIRNNEFEISEKLLRSTTNIRGNVEGSLAALDNQDYMAKIAVATKEAVEARYWLKLIQMKHTITWSGDLCVDQLNEIISILAYMTQKGTKSNLKLDIHNLN